MKILIFSDLHAHPFKEGKVLEDGRNSNLLNCVSALNEIYEHAEDNGIDIILFGGDLFHTRRRVDISAFNAIHEALSEWVIPAYFLSGNHDQYNRLGSIHSLEVIEDINYIEVIDKPRFITLNKNTSLLAIPYIAGETKFKVTLNKAINKISKIAHANNTTLEHILGLFHVGIDIVLKSNISINDLHREMFDFVFLGHHHTPKQLADNVAYVGSPLQHTWVDADDEQHGFSVYDTETKEYQRYALNNYPNFFIKSSLEEEPTAGDFIHIKLPANYDDDEIAEYKRRAEEVGATVIVKKEKTVAKSNRHSIDLLTSKTKMVKEYVNIRLDDDSLDKETVIATGLALLESYNAE